MIRPPIIVRGDGELVLFRSLESAVSYLEHYDVDDGVYDKAFDSKGTILALGTTRAKAWKEPTVTLREAEGEPARPEQLRELLIDSLAVTGIENLHRLSLDQLVEEASKRYDIIS